MTPLTTTIHTVAMARITTTTIAEEAGGSAVEALPVVADTWEEKLEVP